MNLLRSQRQRSRKGAIMQNLHVDALVVGGGIAGMQAAIDLGDQGFQVALVEREPSIGGKMITLSKVFPTLDCCSCITTPKMSAVAHHPNIQLFTYCEVSSMDENDMGFNVSILKKPRYVDEDKCTGCRQCEYECPITVSSSFDRGLGSYRAIRVPFSTAVPQTALLDIENCLLCGKCEKVCPVEAVDFTQEPETFEINATAVVLATGFELTRLDAKKEYGGGVLPNVIEPLMMERFLAPTAALMDACYVLAMAWSRLPSLMSSVLVRAIKPRASNTAPAFAACTLSNRPCSSAARCPWPISPSITWTSVPLAKATSSSIRTRRLWASSSCAARWLPFGKMSNTIRLSNSNRRKTAAFLSGLTT